MYPIIQDIEDKIEKMRHTAWFHTVLNYNPGILPSPPRPVTFIKPNFSAGMVEPGTLRLDMPMGEVDYNFAMHILLAPEWAINTDGTMKSKITLRAGLRPGETEGERALIYCKDGGVPLVHLPYRLPYLAVWDGAQWYIPDAIVAT